ncbi:MAG: nitroreductase [Flavobacteriia bacterium]|nr:nitroreductase [Flavobacteriia bacterium]
MEKSINDIIAQRRTIKPDKYTGATLDDQVIRELLDAANWAPTHGYTEPWRFVVFTEDGKESLIDLLYKLDVEDHGENDVRYSKLRARIERSSHVIAIGMKRGVNPKIPAIEEAQAVAAAVQNMWILASAKGLGAYWSTGAIGYDKRLSEALGWDGEEDSAMGFFYVGDYAGEWPEGRRISPYTDKVRWERG